MPTYKTVTEWLHRRREARVLAETYTPAREPNVRADVLVPLLWSLVTGLLGGTWLTLIGSQLFGWFDVWPAWAVITSSCVLLAWLAKSDAMHQTLWRIEPTLQRDGDGTVGQPARAVPFPVNPRQGQDAAAKAAEKAERQKLASFIRCAEDDSSQRALERRFSRVQIGEYRQLLILQGFAAWNNSRDQRAGWKLLLSSNEIIQQLLFPPTLLTEDVKKQ